MSAKDPRKVIFVRLPRALRGLVRQERSRGRSNSAAAAIRRIVERQLPQGGVSLGAACEPSAQAYRLQLSQGSRRRLEALARDRAVTPEHVVIQLLAGELQATGHRAEAPRVTAENV